jgi:hypothetical protein
MRASHALFIAAAAVAVLRTPVQSQQLFTFSINPSLGATFGLHELPQRFAIRGKDTNTEVLSASLDQAVTMKTSLGLRWGKYVGIEGVFALTPSSLHSNNLDDVAVDVLGYSLNATGYLPLGKPGREFFVSAGGGIKRYDFFFFRSWSENAWTWNIGSGFNVPINNRIAVHLEARDHISTFASNIPGVESARQNDLTLSVGFAFSVNSETAYRWF